MDETPYELEEETAPRLTQSPEMRNLMDAANARLGQFCWTYLVGVNSVASLGFDDEIAAPEPSDLGPKVENVSDKVEAAISSLLNCSPINDTEVIRDFFPDRSLDRKAPGDYQLMQEALCRQASCIILDLLNRTDAEVYELSQKAFDRYDSQYYHVLLETVGYVHFRKPEDCWAILSAEWTD